MSDHDERGDREDEHDAMEEEEEQAASDSDSTQEEEEEEEEEEMRRPQRPRNAKAPARNRAGRSAKQRQQDEEGGSLATRPQLDRPPSSAAVALALGEDVRGEDSEVPSHINQHLFPYQRDGVRFLFGLFQEGKGGLLGDEMGLGKTIQVISFLVAVFHKTNTHHDTRSDPLLIPYKSIVQRTVIKDDEQEGAVQREEDEQVPVRALVIAPPSLLANWEREIETWSFLTVTRVHGPNKIQVLGELIRGTCGAEVVLTSYTTFGEYVGELNRVPWTLVIMDELHTIKNPNTRPHKAVRALRTGHRYGLSGTPIQNKMEEAFFLLELLQPQCLGGSLDGFKGYYRDPILQGQKVSATTAQLKLQAERAAEWKMVLDKYFLARKKADFLQDKLPAKEDKIVFCPLSPLQKFVYRRVLDSPEVVAMLRSKGFAFNPRFEDMPYVLFDSVAAHRNGHCDQCPMCLVLPVVTKLQLIAEHVELLRPSLPANPDEVALAKYRQQVKFAKFAFGEHAGKFISPHQRFTEASDIAKHSGKMRVLHKTLEEFKKNNDKVVVFSRSLMMLDIIQQFFELQGYSFLRMDGKTPIRDRQRLVDRFQNEEDLFIFLLSTKVGGVGLNLTAANKLIVFDPSWNPSDDLQAQDRLYRIGQTRNVSVFRLVSAHSIEETMYWRQVYKQQTAALATEGVAKERLFDAVRGQDDGELWGFANLLAQNSLKWKEVQQRAEGAKENDDWFAGWTMEAHASKNGELAARGQGGTKLSEGPSHFDPCPMGSSSRLSATAITLAARRSRVQQQQQQQQDEEAPKAEGAKTGKKRSAEEANNDGSAPRLHGLTFSIRDELKAKAGRGSAPNPAKRPRWANRNKDRLKDAAPPAVSGFALLVGAGGEEKGAEKDMKKEDEGKEKGPSREQSGVSDALGAALSESSVLSRLTRQRAPARAVSKKQPEAQAPALLDHPEHIFPLVAEVVCEHLDGASVAQCMAVCRSWHQALHERSLSGTRVWNFQCERAVASHLLPRLLNQNGGSLRKAYGGWVMTNTNLEYDAENDVYGSQAKARLLERKRAVHTPPPPPPVESRAPKGVDDVDPDDTDALMEFI